MHQVFISYSHDDAEWLDSLVFYLGVHSRKSQDDSKIEFWSDRNIASGQRWEGQIGAALKQVSAAVLLVSEHFRKSKFIRDKELPALLELHEDKGIPLLWIAIDDWLEDVEVLDFKPLKDLRSIKALNNPAKPLTKLQHDYCRRKFEQMAQEIHKTVLGVKQSRNSTQNKLSESLGLRLEVAPFTPRQLPRDKPSRGLFRKGNSDAFSELKAYIDSNKIQRATLIQMSCINEKVLIHELWRKEAKVELFLSSGGQEFGVSKYQRKRIEQFLCDLQNELFCIKGCPESGEIAIYKYAAPASVRAVLLDDKILAFGPYLYEVHPVPVAKKKPKLLDVRGAELPLLVLRKADPDFEMIRELISDLVKNWKSIPDWKKKRVAEHVVTIQHRHRRRPQRDLVKLWRGKKGVTHALQS